jgi:hypothetical protein
VQKDSRLGTRRAAALIVEAVAVAHVEHTGFIGFDGG